MGNYVGEYKNDILMVFGTYIWPDGDKYVDSYWCRHGMGFHSRVMVLYMGNFVNNLPQETVPLLMSTETLLRRMEHGSKRWRGCTGKC